MESKYAFKALLAPGQTPPPRLGYAIDRTAPRIQEALDAIERSEARIKERYIEERIPCVVESDNGRPVHVRDLGKDEQPELEDGQEIGERQIYTDPAGLADELEELYAEETEVEIHQVSIYYLDEKDYWLENELRAPVSFLFTDTPT